MLIEEDGMTFTFYPNHEEDARKFFDTYEFAGFDFLITSERTGLGHADIVKNLTHKLNLKIRHIQFQSF